MNSMIYKIKLWWLWLACSFRFRWAHRPLCERFRPGVIKIGGVYLCRSCVCVYCGIFICGLSLVLLHPSFAKAIVLLAGLGVPTLVLSGPWYYKNLPRVIQDFLRLSMGAMIALCVYLLICRELLITAAIMIVLFVFWKVYLRARIKRRLHACDGCVELSDNKICTGCALQAESMRRYEEIATQLYLKSGQIPDIARTITRK